jgi:uncharacterized protein YifN (PemK superfamily)
MVISFAPERDQILICNFDFGRLSPEMSKTRRAIVVSPRSHNQGHGQQPGRSIVVPLSATTPKQLMPTHVYFPVGQYASFGVDLWAICDCLSHVSHDRLDRVKHRGQWLREFLTAADLVRVEEGVRHAVGLRT